MVLGPLWNLKIVNCPWFTRKPLAIDFSEFSFWEVKMMTLFSKLTFTSICFLGSNWWLVFSSRSKWRGDTGQSNVKMWSLCCNNFIVHCVQFGSYVASYNRRQNCSYICIFDEKIFQRTPLPVEVSTSATSHNRDLKQYQKWGFRNFPLSLFNLP